MTGSIEGTAGLTETAQPESKNSKYTLRTRHISMIGLGGTIGAGLFVGSSEVIHNAGPLAFITYAFTGFLCICVLRMISEMVVASPIEGSFVDYARVGLGRLPGFLTGWLYWYFWVIVVGIEAVVSGQTFNRWIDIPAWLIGLILITIMTGVNLLSARAFGEAEYWFSSIKVVTVLLFIVLAVLFIVGIWPNGSPQFANFNAGGDLLPNGPLPLVGAVGVVIWSMTGGELIAVAAADSDNPRQSVRKAARSVAARVLIFFVISMLLVVTVVPWSNIEPGKSPFVTGLERMGIPGAPDILTAVILTAVLSLMNSSIYTASRLTLSMAKHSDAPQWFSKTNDRGVPVRSVLVSSLVGYVCVFFGFFFPNSVFSFLVNSAGVIMAVVYIMIVLAEIRLRWRWNKEGREVPVKMWLFPGLSIFVAMALAAVIVALACQSDTRGEVVQSGVAAVAFLIAFAIKEWVSRRNRIAEHSGTVA